MVICSLLLTKYRKNIKISCIFNAKRDKKASEVIVQAQAARA